MRSSITAIVFLLAFVGVYALPTNVSADQMNVNPFSITISPSSPTPYEPFTISITDGSVDLSNSTFSIYVNGKKINTSSQKTVSTRATGAGTLMSIKTNVYSVGKTYTKTVYIRPLGLAVITEPISSAPPLYPGKTNTPVSGEVRLVAIPDFRTLHGKVINPKTLSYTWRVTSSQNMLIASGIGRDAITVHAPQLPFRTKTISVLVQNKSATIAISREIDITGTDPFVLVYKDDPLMGILYNKALTDSYSISNNETSFIAEPYGFTKNSGAPLFNWFLNDQSVQKGNKITLRPKGDGAGRETLSVSATDEETSANASTGFDLLFGATKKSSWFFKL